MLLVCWNQGDYRWNLGSKKPPRCWMDWSGNNLWRSNILTRKESWERPTSNFCKCQFVPLNGCFGSEIVFEIDQQKQVDFWTFGHLDPNVKQFSGRFFASQSFQSIFLGCSKIFDIPPKMNILLGPGNRVPSKNNMDGHHIPHETLQFWQFNYNFFQVPQPLKPKWACLKPWRLNPCMGQNPSWRNFLEDKPRIATGDFWSTEYAQATIPETTVVSWLGVSHILKCSSPKQRMLQSGCSRIGASAYPVYPYFVAVPPFDLTCTSNR